MHETYSYSYLCSVKFSIQYLVSGSHDDTMSLQLAIPIFQSIDLKCNNHITTFSQYRL